MKDNIISYIVGTTISLVIFCLDNADSDIMILAGLFDTEGVSETAQDITEELNGIPIGRIGPRIQYMVRKYNIRRQLYCMILFLRYYVT